MTTGEAIDRCRRRSCGTAALTIAAAGLTTTDAAQAQQPGNSTLPAIKPGTHTSFAPLKQINAGLLNAGCAEAGPADGPPVIFLHGRPYDIHSFVDVGPLPQEAPHAFAKAIMNVAQS